MGLGVRLMAGFGVRAGVTTGGRGATVVAGRPEGTTGAVLVGAGFPCVCMCEPGAAAVEQAATVTESSRTASTRRIGPPSWDALTNQTEPVYERGKSVQVAVGTTRRQASCGGETDISRHAPTEGYKVAGGTFAELRARTLLPRIDQRRRRPERPRVRDATASRRSRRIDCS